MEPSRKNITMMGRKLKIKFIIKVFSLYLITATSQGRNYFSSTKSKNKTNKMPVRFIFFFFELRIQLIDCFAIDCRGSVDHAIPKDDTCPLVNIQGR